MKRKIYDNIEFMTSVYLIMVFIDFITTLFSIKEIGEYESILGIIFTKSPVDNGFLVMATVGRVFIIYIVLVLVVIGLTYIRTKFSNRKKLISNKLKKK